MKMKKFALLLAAAAFLAMPVGCKKTPKEIEPEQKDEEEEKVYPTYATTEEPNPFSWVAVDDQGNSIDPDSGDYPDVAYRKERTVAIFYFLWHGCHGYDRGANNNTDGFRHEKPL